MTSPESRSTSQDALEVLQLLREQCDLYEQIESLASEQSQFIERDQPAHLLKLLTQRQHLVSRLGRSSRALEPYRARWDSIVSTLNSDQRAEARRLIERSDALRSAIQARDEADCSKLAVSKGRIDRELQNMSRASQARSAYGATGRPSVDRLMNDRRA